MDNKLYNLKDTQNNSLWGKELYNPNDHLPETKEYGITSFVYRARDPFDPEKIHSFFNQEWPGVIRSKGFFGYLLDLLLLKKFPKQELL